MVFSVIDIYRVASQNWEHCCANGVLTSEERKAGTKLMLMRSAALLLAPLTLIATGVAQTRPLSVCDIVAHAADWDNNVVLIRAHYRLGMEDSFLFDDRCQGKTIWFDYPESAAQEDALLKDKLSSKRKAVTLDKNRNLAELEHYAGMRDESNQMCQRMDIEITAVGRIDSKRGIIDKKNCEPFGMCNYPARFVLASVREVTANESKQPCRK